MTITHGIEVNRDVGNFLFGFDASIDKFVAGNLGESSTLANVMLTRETGTVGQVATVVSDSGNIGFTTIEHDQIFQPGTQANVIVHNNEVRVHTSDSERIRVASDGSLFVTNDGDQYSNIEAGVSNTHGLSQTGGIISFHDFSDNTNPTSYVVTPSVLPTNRHRPFTMGNHQGYDKGTTTALNIEWNQGHSSGQSDNPIQYSVEPYDNSIRIYPLTSSVYMYSFLSPNLVTNRTQNNFDANGTSNIDGTYPKGDANNFNISRFWKIIDVPSITNSESGSGATITIHIRGPHSSGSDGNLKHIENTPWENLHGSYSEITRFEVSNKGTGYKNGDKLWPDMTNFINTANASIYGTSESYASNINWAQTLTSEAKTNWIAGIEAEWSDWTAANIAANQISQYGSNTQLDLSAFDGNKLSNIQDIEYNSNIDNGVGCLEVAWLEPTQVQDNRAENVITLKKHNVTSTAYSDTPVHLATQSWTLGLPSHTNSGTSYVTSRATDNLPSNVEYTDSRTHYYDATANDFVIYKNDHSSTNPTMRIRNSDSKVFFRGGLQFGGDAQDGYDHSLVNSGAINIGVSQMNVAYFGTGGIKFNTADWGIPELHIHKNGTLQIRSFDNTLSATSDRTTPFIVNSNDYIDGKFAMQVIGKRDAEHETITYGINISRPTFTANTTPASHSDQMLPMQWSFQKSDNTWNYWIWELRPDLMDLNGDFMFTTDGRMGIGVTTPACALDVNGSVLITGQNATSSSILADSAADANVPLVIKGHSGYNGASSNTVVQRYFSSDYDLSYTTNGFSHVSMAVEGNIYTKSHVVAGSDERIKKDIVNADTKTCIDVVNEIPTRQYKYKDPITKGYNTVYGYIAQEANIALPECVQLKTEYIPSIMQLSSNVTIAEGDGNIATFNVPNVIDSTITKGTTIKFICENTASVTEEYGTVIDLQSGTSITVQFQSKPDGANLESQLEVMNTLFSGNVFLYGHKVDDFHTIDKTKITVVHHGAIQYLSQENQELKVKNAQLESQLANLVTWASTQGFTQN